VTERKKEAGMGAKRHLNEKIKKGGERGRDVAGTRRKGWSGVEGEWGGRRYFNGARAMCYRMELKDNYTMSSIRDGLIYVSV